MIAKSVLDLRLHSMAFNKLKYRQRVRDEPQRLRKKQSQIEYDEARKVFEEMKLQQMAKDLAPSQNTINQ